MVGQGAAAGNGSGELEGLTQGLLVPKWRYLVQTATQRTSMSWKKVGKVCEGNGQRCLCLVSKSFPCLGVASRALLLLGQVLGTRGKAPSPGVSPEGR